MSLHYNSVIDALSSRVNRLGINYSLDQFASTLSALGNPHKKLSNVIHVAGTNGKGSTLAYISGALQQLGHSVGTYTSPHIRSYAERIQLNGADISDEKFAHYFNRVDAAAPEKTLTEFEILTIMAFCFFVDEAPDFVCIEVGLGGRLDATNVVTPLVSVISKIDMDHQAVLGETIGEIALEKAGIIKSGRPVVTTSKQVPDVMTVLAETADQHGSELVMAESAEIDLGMTGSYQVDNCGISIAVLDQLAQMAAIVSSWRDSIDFKLVQLPWGRFTVVQDGARTIVVDGAHNPAAVDVMIRSLKTHFPGKMPTFLMGFSKGKDVLHMLEVVQAYSKSIYCCEFDDMLSEPFDNVMDSTDLDIMRYNLGDKLPDGELLVITGSLYFVSHFWEILC